MRNYKIGLKASSVRHFRRLFVIMNRSIKQRKGGDTNITTKDIEKPKEEYLEVFPPLPHFITLLCLTSAKQL